MPRIAPIVAGLAPERNACAFIELRKRSKKGPPRMTNKNEGAKAIPAAINAPVSPEAAYPTTAIV